MPRYNYRARDAQGQLAQGTIDAPDRASAIQGVERKGCTPFRIEAEGAEARPAAVNGVGGATMARARPATPSATGASRHRAPASIAPSPARTAARNERLSHNQRLFFTEQLAYLLSAGMTLDEALAILVKRLKQPALHRLTGALHQALIDGKSFSQALREYPRIFAPLYVNLVMAGEASGALVDILSRLVKHLASMKQLRDRIQQALIYPAFLAFAGAGLIVLFITVMVPQLTTFFQNTNGGTLPLPTRILMGANHILTTYWWVAALAGAAGYSIFKALTRSPAGRMRWDRFRLGVPALGSVMRYGFYAQFARTMGTLLQNGVTLLRAIELLEDMSGNSFLKGCLNRTRAALVDGSSLSSALGRERIFPELYLDMMAVGEQSGRFAETMQMVADVYERELDTRIKVATSIIPPLIIVCIAVVVGAVVFSIISAVFSVTSSLQIHAHH